MAVLHLAATDDDVFRGFAGKTALTALAAVVVTGTLDGDAVVARVEVAVFDEYTVARLRVAAVAVGPVIINMYATYGNIGRQQGVDDPEGRPQQGDVLNEDALALVQVNHLGTQTVLRTEAALVHVDTVLGIFQQTGTGTLVLGYAALFHAEALVAAPGPPCLVRATAVNGTLARDGDVLGLVGIDERREVPTVQTLPACGHDGVQVRLEGEFQYGTLLHDEVHATLQLDGSCQEVLALGNDDAAATLLRAFVDGFLNGLLVLGSYGTGLL